MEGRKPSLAHSGRKRRVISIKMHIHREEAARIGSAMAQMPQNRASDERPRYAFYSDSEVRYWTDRLGVSPEDVRAAVKRVRAMVGESRRDSRR
jgi:hypothetical protein